MKNVHIENSLEKDILTIEQAKQLILSNKDNRRYIWHYLDYAILYLMLTTGLRSIEIRRSKHRDLSMINNKPILYIQGKGKRSKDAFVKLSKDVDEAIRDYLEKRKDINPYLFISYSHRGDTPYLSRTFFKSMFQRILSVAGLENLKVSPHSLRHTAATINLARGGTLEETKRLMRHSNLSTTLLYSHHLEGMKDDVESAIEQFILSDHTRQRDDERLVCIMNKHPLEDLSERFIQTSTFRPQTMKSYRIAFKYYIFYLKKHHIVFATTSDVIRYRESRRNLGYSSDYIHIHMAALRGLYRYLRLNQKSLNLANEYAYDIMIPIKNENVHYHLKKPMLTLEQARHLITLTKIQRRFIWHY